MSRTLLKLSGMGKRFEIFKVKQTLFNLAQDVVQRLPLSEEFWALKDINLEVREGDKIAVIGRNGAGKSTLFRVMSGIYDPTEGSIEASAPVRPLFRYGTGMNGYMAVLDNIYMLGAFYGLSVSEVRKKIPEILAFSELEKFVYLPVKNLSSGQIGRLSFSVFIQNRENFLAFDESTAMADILYQKKMGEYFKKMMADDSKTVLMASHSVDDLKRYCRTAVWLEKGRIMKAGPVSEVLEEYRSFCAKLPAEPVLR